MELRIGVGSDGRRKGQFIRTFSSSLRFSLRFLRRRAISARRMACSSAVRCFLTWTSERLLVLSNEIHRVE